MIPMQNVLTVIAVSRRPERSEGKAKQSNGQMTNDKDWINGRLE